MIQKLRQEINSFQIMDKLFLVFVMITGFLISTEYGITRPASNALLLSQFSAATLPWIWLATVPFNFLIISVYNHYLPRLGPLKLLGSTALITVVMNLLTAAFLPTFPGLILFQFIWKDIYVLLMFKQLWSLIHASIASHRAKYLYGIIYAMGTAGAISGNLIPGLFAVEMGSRSLFLFTLPIYLCAFLFYRKAYQYSPVSKNQFFEEIKEKEPLFPALKSPLLLSILALVILMQTSIGLMEFQFNVYLEKNIFGADLRTQYIGKILSLTNLLSGIFQLAGSFMLVQLLGVRRSHLAVPLIFLLNIAGLIFFPSFGFLTFSFIFMKAIDFSLFGVIREMLYIPMKLNEKYRAKAIIDVFAYRSSKAFVSLSILGLQLITASHFINYLNNLLIGIFLVWLGIVWLLIYKHYPANALDKAS